MTKTKVVSTKKIFVNLIEYNPLLKRFIEAKLKSVPEIYLHRQGKAGAMLVQNKPLSYSAVVLIDKGAAGPRFSSLVRQVVSSTHPFRIAVIDNEDISVSDLSSLILGGIHGFVPYTQVERQLIHAIRALSRGELWFAPAVLDHYVKASKSLIQKNKSSNHELTFRQEQIMGFIKKGLHNKEMAAALNISESTVKFHLARIFFKLGVPDKRSILVQTSSGTVEQTCGKISKAS
jgi:DNA-binding NarL/FixJ family response regulator